MKIIAWLVALAWATRSLAAHLGLPKVPNLLLPEFDLWPRAEPTLTVIVPARDEGANIRDCLESLLAQDYPNLKILAVNDRSSDQTSAIIDELAASHPGRLAVLHIQELPPGWLGKTHAMAVAARMTESDFLLFTDADVIFHPASLRRALANMEASRADHLVLMPTTVIRRWDEAALLGFFQIFGLWGPRIWRVQNPGSVRDAIGIGAFNLIRRTAYRQIGGFDAFPMEILEDLGLGRRVKRAGLHQRVAVGRGLVQVHWAAGVPGLVNVMTKNIFSAFNFHPSLVLLACGWLVVFCVAPFAAIFVPGFLIPACITVAAIGYGYVLMGRLSGLSAWNFLFTPFAALAFIFTLLRSMTTTLRQGGVIWRGTFYSLKELRKNAVPFALSHRK